MAGINQMSRQMGISKGKASSLMKKAKKMNGYAKGGSAEEEHIEWGRKKLDRGTEQLIQGTDFQVRGRYFNDNGGEGTF